MYSLFRLRKRLKIKRLRCNLAETETAKSVTNPIQTYPNIPFHIKYLHRPSVQIKLATSKPFQRFVMG